ncbi:translocator protein-like isoform X2 [Lineus longissimus]
MAWGPIIFGVVHPHIGGILGGIVTRKEIESWYSCIKKPWFTPPNWVFGPVWTSLYTGMGYASYLTWKDGGGFGGEAKTALALYGSQLMLNWMWSPVFFGKHKIRLGAVILWATWGTAAATGYKMYAINPTAGYLMIPYMVWLTLAGAINTWVAMNNSVEMEE